MPDTTDNQKAYPQPSTQAPGFGFPIAKIGVLFSLATGAAIALAINASDFESQLIISLSAKGKFSVRSNHGKS